MVWRGGCVKRSRFPGVHSTSTAVAVVLLGLSCWAQAPSPSAQGTPNDALASVVRDLQSEVRQLQSALQEVRSEAAQSRLEMQALRKELQETRHLLQQPPARGDVYRTSSATPLTQTVPEAEPSTRADTTPDAASATDTAATSNDRLQKLEESVQLLNAKVDDQYQTKVESASKYRMRLSGIVLMNLFGNHGAFDNQDIPSFSSAVAPGDPSHNVGATLRQSQIGLEVFGPTVWNARTSANVQLDFAGGFNTTANNGVDFGLVRLQTASMRLDWDHTSVVAGQDSLFISPLSPTSFASLAVPALGSAGNLWAWTPQLRVEHRFDLPHEQTITLQGGILDNLDWEPNPSNDPSLRAPQAGERSGQPAYALRSAWSHPLFGQSLSFGGAAYYSRQDWGWVHSVEGWAALADWQIPLAPRLALTGEFYDGDAVGGLGGGVGRSVLFSGDPGSPYSHVTALDSIGGWSQLKFRATSKVEFNGAFGVDNASAAALREYAAIPANFAPLLARNRGTLGNIIYRPRSDLLFSAEFRRLRTNDAFGATSMSDQINLSMGVLF